MKGIIFDMDGTMVDNMMVHHRAWQKKLLELGVEMSLEEVMDKVHGVNVEILERLFGDRFTPEQRVRISEEKELAYRDIFRPHLKLLDGLPAFLRSCGEAQIPLAIATAAPPENVDFVLDHLTLRDYFKAVFHAQSVGKGKPDPEVILKAAASLSVLPHQCIVFEDSVTGAEAAMRAGAQAIIVTTTHRAEEFAQFNHILRFISDFTEIKLDDLSVVA